MNLYQEVIYKSRYARYIEDQLRREEWDETVARFVNYINNKVEGKLSLEEYNRIFDAILNLEVMPSMRLLMTAGEACDRDNICAYNCAYVAINSKRCFSEILYILMCGTGVGFSVEREEINKLPAFPINFRDTDDTIVVADSKLGWAKAFRKLLSSLWEGDVPKVDYSRIRPAGSRLRVFGGRASGPDPLRKLFTYCVSVAKRSAGRKLTSIEIHDIVCMIGEIVVVGGVRRSALISLSNLTDRRMREAKVGRWWDENNQRALANNSVVYTEKPDVETFMEEWLSLIKSKSGERGIFNRVAASNQASRFGLRDPDRSYGCNPCSEIILRDKQFCNLTEVVVRPSDSYEDLQRKVRIATILGTIQSTLTSFQFISEEWKTNCEEERLLGVSLTGIMDHPFLNGSKEMDADYSHRFCGDEDKFLYEVLEELRELAVTVNREWADQLGINPSCAICCVKPSGTVSELTGTSSGIHPRYSDYYYRTIRQDNKDPLTDFLKDAGVYSEPAKGAEGTTTVFYFPIQSPEESILRNDITAIEQLEHWLVYQNYWCHHKPSVTVYVKPHEWLEVGSWVFKHFDEISGISFLPFSDHIYDQAPFQEISEDVYVDAVIGTPKKLDWNKLKEEDDNTTFTPACSGPICELDRGSHEQTN